MHHAKICVRILRNSVRVVCCPHPESMEFLNLNILHSFCLYGFFVLWDSSLPFIFDLNYRHDMHINQKDQCVDNSTVSFANCWHAAFAHLLLYINNTKFCEMPDEYCRKCGNEQTTYAKCAKCRKEIQRICIRCGQRTIEQFHAHCFYEIECLQVTTSRKFELMI